MAFPAPFCLVFQGKRLGLHGAIESSVSFLEANEVSQFITGNTHLTYFSLGFKVGACNSWRLDNIVEPTREQQHSICFIKQIISFQEVVLHCGTGMGFAPGRPGLGSNPYLPMKCTG